MGRPRQKFNRKPHSSKPLDKGKIIRDLAILAVLISLLLIALKYVGVWNDISYRLEIGLAGGFIIFAFLLWKVLSLYLNANEYSERKDFIDLHAKILGSAALVISLLFTWQGIKNNQKTSEENQRLTLQSLENAEKRQIEDRYNKALEQLGSEKREARLGAIYSLGKIAADSIEFSKKNQGSKDFYWEIVQTLAAYIRGNAPVTKVSGRLSKEMPTDIQAALNVLAWRSRSFQNGEDQRLELYGTDLRGLILKDIEPSQNNPQAQAANFEGARFSDANFEDANLRGINFRNAILTNVIFKNAYLAQADMTDAELEGADLEGADLGNAKIDADRIMSAKNWEKAKILPRKVCQEIEQRNKESEKPEDMIESPKGCK